MARVNVFLETRRIGGDPTDLDLAEQYWAHAPIYDGPNGFWTRTVKSIGEENNLSSYDVLVRVNASTVTEMKQPACNTCGGTTIVRSRAAALDLLKDLPSGCPACQARTQEERRRAQEAARAAADARKALVGHRGAEWISTLQRKHDDETGHSQPMTAAAHIALLAVSTICFHEGERPWGDIFAVNYQDAQTREEMSQIAQELLTFRAVELRNPSDVFSEGDGELMWDAHRCLFSPTPEGLLANEAWARRIQHAIDPGEATALLSILEHILYQEVTLLLDYEVAQFGRRIEFTPQQAATLRRRVRTEHTLQLGALHGGVWIAAQRMVATSEKNPRMSRAAVSGYVLNQISKSWEKQREIPHETRRLYHRTHIPVRTYTDTMFSLLLDLNPVETSFETAQAAILDRICEITTTHSEEIP